jgi:hypothetical protein
MAVNTIQYFNLIHMAHQNEKDAYYKFFNDLSKIIGTNDKPKPPKFDAFGNPWNSTGNSNGNSYVSSAGCNNFSAAFYVGCCGSYSCSVVPNA